MELELGGKSVVVTGAGRGIGLAIARGFAGAGAHVVAGTLTVSPELDELARAGSAIALSLDLTSPEAAGQLVDAADGRIDVLVNNVGAAPPRLEGFLAVTDEM
jgi:NAD(P)-dependent dehydrogenase (short-subunit alcohol dehydrogenase family)